MEALASSSAVVTVLGFFGVKALSRIDKLEQEKASKSDLTSLIDEMRADRESAKESRVRLYERVNNIGESLARLEGRIGK